MLYTKIRQEAPQDAKQIETICTLTGISPITAGILLRRKVTEPAQITEFLQGKEQPYYDPFLLKGMASAVDRILLALKQKEKITIYGDYDVDGTTASSLLYLFLRHEGADVHTYIPRRDTEGYGLNGAALQKIAKEHTTLLLTVDTGISGADVVASAPVAMDIIITDHHLAPVQLPQVLAVINPNQPGDGYPFKGLAGVGVAFKLCQALWQKLHHTDDFWDEGIALVTLGTVADMVPLLDENREIVRKGLKKIPESTLPGLKALLNVTLAPGAPVNTGTIGFGLGPRINAAGRLDDAMTAVNLMTTDDEKQAAALAAELDSANQERQALSQKIFEEALAELSSAPVPQWGIVVGKEDWHPGVIGIVASRLTEKFQQPSVLLSIQGETAKGSCRSIPPVHLYHALERCKDLLIQFGGHAQAAGLTLKTGNIPAFREKFCQVVAEMLGHQPYEPSCTPDYFVPREAAVGIPQVQELEKLAPFGVGNPAPVLGFVKAEIAQVDRLGKERNHLKFDVVHGGTHYKGLLWQAGDRYHAFYPGEEACVAFSPSLNTFRGNTSVNLEICGVEAPYTIIDYRHENKDKKTLLQSILQTEKKTVVYSHEPVAIQKAFPQATVRAYGEHVPKGSETVVFYDAGAERVLQEGHFPLQPDETGKLVLLYDRDELVAKRQTLRHHYPDIAGLRCCYAAIREKLSLTGVYSEKDLIGTPTREGYILSQQVLSIFYTLQMFFCHEGLVSLGETTKKDLQASAAFQALQADYTKALQALNRAWQISPKEIADLWRQKR